MQDVLWRNVIKPYSVIHIDIIREICYVHKWQYSILGKISVLTPNQSSHEMYIKTK